MTTQLVLGGTGFLGSHLAQALAQTGERVIAVGRRTPEKGSAYGVEYRSLDLYACSQATLDDLIASADVVYHLVWSSFAASAELDPEADLKANVGFTVRLLQAARHKATRVVFCSSGGTVYGSSQKASIDEDDPLRPITAYGAAKLTAEIYGNFFRHAHDVDVRIARVANPFGVGQSPERLQGALTRFAYKALAGAEIEIWGDGETIRDYIHVDDAVEALKRLGDAERKDLGPDPTFNIGSGLGKSLNELISLLEEKLDRSLIKIYKPGRRIDVSSNVLSIGRARTILAWQPSMSIEDGVSKLIHELRKSKNAYLRS
jgi:UDP-glucose 4-epimerase